MIKEAKISHIKESQHDVIYPIYKIKDVCHQITEITGYNLSSDVDKSFGKVTIIHTLGRLPYRHIYFVGLGDIETITESKLLEAFGKVIKSVESDQVTVDLKRAISDEFNFQTLAKIFSEACVLANYKFEKDSTLNEKKNTYYLISKEPIEKAIFEGRVVGEAVNQARNLANMPSNLLNPLDLANHALSIAEKHQLEIDLYDNERLEAIEAGGILAVNQGSAIEARLIIVKYQGAKDAPFTAIVGKGVTFDSGGYNLKPATSMTNMKSDMSGAATVLATLEAVAKLNLPVNLYAIVPTTENMINGDAYKCDDVITTLSKKTVEVTNTDAEGRIVLADALTYVGRLKVAKIIDVATLTGACVIALGEKVTGAFSNDDKFYAEIEKASRNASELIWRLPLYPHYNEYLKKSLVADLINTAIGQGGGASIAASFLQEFVPENVSWVHLDIAATASAKTASTLTPKGATGVMVKTLMHYFLNQI